MNKKNYLKPSVKGINIDMKCMLGNQESGYTDENAAKRQKGFINDVDFNEEDIEE